MLKSLLALFEDSRTQQKPAYTLELATAALFCEVINADYEVTQTERAEYEKQLRKHVSIDEETLKTLLMQGEEKAESAVDLVQFTQVIVRQCSAEERIQIIKSLWAIAYADRSLAPLEESTVRQIAELLYVPHSQFIKTKLEVLDNTASEEK